MARLTAPWSAPLWCTAPTTPSGGCRGRGAAPGGNRLLPCGPETRVTQSVGTPDVRRRASAYSADATRVRAMTRHIATLAGICDPGVIPGLPPLQRSSKGGRGEAEPAPRRRSGRAPGRALDIGPAPGPALLLPGRVERRHRGAARCRPQQTLQEAAGLTPEHLRGGRAAGTAAAADAPLRSRSLLRKGVGLCPSYTTSVDGNAADAAIQGRRRRAHDRVVIRARYCLVLALQDGDLGA